MKKRVLLIIPEDYQLFVLIEKNLIHLGYEVITIVKKPIAFRYNNFFQRLYNVWRKLIDGNNSFKQSLIDSHTIQYNIDIMKKQEVFDYGLVFRADFFNIELLKYAKSKCQKFVSYHYDGLDRNPEVKDLIPLFDKFFVFDKNDLVMNNIYETYLSNNFYFDYDIGTDDKEEKLMYDVFFLGYYNEGRENVLLNFYKEIKESIKDVHFEIVFTEVNKYAKDKYEKLGILCRESTISFESYLDHVKRSKIIVDFLIGEHNGLSFRIFEGLKYQRKVITTNSSIRNYDFYHPDNFFILDDKEFDKDEILNFLHRPYFNIDENIRVKYSFTGWLKHVLS